MSMRVSTLLFALSVFLAGCVSPPKTELPPIGESKDAGIFFIADPQLHNTYGIGVRQMLPAADIVSRVAIRPPELNLLAPYVLADLLSQAKSAAGQPPLVVALGDLSNIACSGEYDDFVGVMSTAWKDGLWLAAHGNHDSYLIGTVNSYVPRDTVTDWKPKLMANSPLPTDESWWGRHITPTGARNWRDGCYRPHEHSAPMNKVRWLARYLAHLEKHGLRVDKPTSGGEVIPLNFDAASGALLKLNFQVRGVYVKPEFGESPSDSDLLKSYKSFIVQALDVTPGHRLVIIDTALCLDARGGVSFAWGNAGTRACVGKEQLEVIDRLVKEMPAGRLPIFAGHFPLKELPREERAELMRIMSQRGKWTYVSAHSHDPNAAYDWDSGVEVNIGSTTDWPMEAHILYPLPGSSQFGLRRSFYGHRYEGTTKYTPSRASRGSEVCRHLPAAEALAELDLTNVPRRWKSPARSVDCEPADGDDKVWKARGKRLREHINKIAARMSDPQYRQAVLGIAAAASRHESRTFYLGGLLP